MGSRRPLRRHGVRGGKLQQPRRRPPLGCAKRSATSLPTSAASGTATSPKTAPLPTCVPTPARPPAIHRPLRTPPPNGTLPLSCGFNYWTKRVSTLNPRQVRHKEDQLLDEKLAL